MKRSLQNQKFEIIDLKFSSSGVRFRPNHTPRISLIMAFCHFNATFIYSFLNLFSYLFKRFFLTLKLTTSFILLSNLLKHSIVTFVKSLPYYNSNLFFHNTFFYNSKLFFHYTFLIDFTFFGTCGRKWCGTIEP